MKVAVVGGGGFRTPVLESSLRGVAEHLRLDQLALHDIDEARLARIGLVLRGLDAEGGTSIPRVLTTTLPEALEGADAVLVAIRVGGDPGRAIDEQVPLEHGVLGQETVGPGGIAFALRTVPVMQRLARSIAERAPGAWVLNFTNPAGLVTESIRPILGERAIGICDSPTSLCTHVASALGRKADGLRYRYLGLTHLGWLTGVLDGDEDLLPGLLGSPALERIDEARLAGLESVRARGVIPNEYLVYYERHAELASALAGQGTTRGADIARQQRAFWAERDPDPAGALASWRAALDARHSTYMSEARQHDAAPPLDTPPANDASQVPELEHGYGGVAAAFLRAVRAGPATRLTIETPNAGRMRRLDEAAVLEGPCTVGPDGVVADPAPTLPDGLAALVARVHHVERLTVRAAEERSAALALEAMAAHPVVPSREVAARILAAYLERHAELRGWRR
jgi:6-phospho-beta-glucosidase